MNTPGVLSVTWAWRGRVSAVVLARAYAATGTVPDYLKHVEGQ